MTPGGFSSRTAPVAIGPCNRIPACVPICFNHWWHGKYLAALYSVGCWVVFFFFFFRPARPLHSSATSFSMIRSFD